MDVVSEIKEKLNIVDVISSYVTLRKRGSNWFGLCPFHGEKTASFSVNEERGFYHCFGCGESGDIFSFMEKVEHIDFRSALEMLGKQAHVDISQGTYDNKDSQKKDKLVEINEFTQKFYTWILKEHESGQIGRDYLKKRKIKEKSIDIFKLGYAPSSETLLYKKLIDRGFTEQEIIEAGVCTVRERDGKVIDKFRNRLMFPIENISGKTVGFSGRYIPTKKEIPNFTPPKYLNTADTPIFNKGKLFYGFNQAKEEIIEKDAIILSEGQVNIIASYQVKEKNIIASMGTALTSDHLKFLSRYTKNIYFCYDNDNAGQNALYKSSKLALIQDFSINVISLQKGSDPDDEIKEYEDLWHSDIKLAKNVFDHFIDKYKEMYKNNNDKNKVLENFVDLFVSCTNPVTKDLLLEKLSGALDLSKDILIEYFAQRSTSINIAPAHVMPTPNMSMSSNNIEEYALALLIQNYELLKQYLDPEYILYFPQNETLYDKLLQEDLNILLQDNDVKDKIGMLLAQNLPHTEHIEKAFQESIKTLKKMYIKYQIKGLKEELSFADEKKQEEILGQIEELIRSIES